MKKVVDYTKSKRPFFVPDSSDREYMEADLNRIGEDIIQIESIVRNREGDAKYSQLVEESIERANQIARRAMALDPKADADLMYEIRGQYLERIRLTKELEGVKVALESKKKRRDNLRKKLHKLIEKLGKR